MEVDSEVGSVSANVGVGLAGARPGVIVATCAAVEIGPAGVRLGALVATVMLAGSGVVSPQAANKAALRITMIDFSTPLIILFPPVCESDNNFVRIITRNDP